MIALFFDTETTGFKTPVFTPDIVQIGALLQDTETKRVLAELNVIVTPSHPIPDKVAAIHGITSDLAAKFGIASETAEIIFTAMVHMADVVVAHNIQFDLGIIGGVWKNASAVLNGTDQYCTMQNCTKVVGIAGTHAGGYKYPKLIEAYRHFFDKEFDNAHDAMADVRACRDVYFALTAPQTLPI